MRLASWKQKRRLQCATNARSAAATPTSSNACKRKAERQLDNHEQLAVSCRENAELRNIALVRPAEQARQVSAQASMESSSLHQPNTDRGPTPVEIRLAASTCRN